MFCPSTRKYYYPDEGTCQSSCNYPYRLQKTYACELELSANDIRQVSALSSITDNAGKVLGVSAFFTSLVDSNDPRAFGLVALTKMLLYTRYMELRFSPRLRYVLDKQTVNQPSVGFIREGQDHINQSIPKYTLPGRFKYYKLHSSFLVNFFQPLILLVGIIVMVAIVCALKILFTKENAFILKLRNIFKWNFMITFLLSYYDGIILYGSFEVKLNRGSSVLELISLITSITVDTIAALVFIRTAMIIRNLHRDLRGTSGIARTLKLDGLKTKYRDYEVVYTTTRDANLGQQAFLCIFSLRVFIFHAVVAYLYKYPLAQAIVILTLSVLMVLYLCIGYPIRDKARLCQYIAQEVVLLIVNAVVLATACLDLNDTRAIPLRFFMGETVLYSNLVLSIIGPVSALIQIIIKVKAYLHARKASREVIVFGNGQKVTLPERVTLAVHDHSVDISKQNTNISGLMLLNDVSGSMRVQDLSIEPFNNSRNYASGIKSSQADTDFVDLQFKNTDGRRPKMARKPRPGLELVSNTSAGMPNQQMEASRPKRQAGSSKSKKQAETSRPKKKNQNQDQSSNQDQPENLKQRSESHKTQGDSQNEPFDLNSKLRSIANTNEHTDVINLLTIRGLDGKKLGPLVRRQKN